MVCLLGVQCRMIIEEKKKEETHTVTWAIAGLNWSGYDSEDVISKESQEKLNKLLEEQGKNYQIKFMVLPSQNGEFTEEQEKEICKADLITMQNQFLLFENEEVQKIPTLIECVDKGIFAPLDEFLETENGKKIREEMLTDLILEVGKWDGNQWVLPNQLNYIGGPAFMIEKNLYEKTGWKETDEFPDFTKCDAVFQLLYERNGKQPFLAMSDEKREMGLNGNLFAIPKFLEDIQSYSGFFEANDAGIGSEISSGDTLNTTSIVSTEYMEEVLNAWARYQSKGYVYTEPVDAPLVKMSTDEIKMSETTSSEKNYVLVRPEEYQIRVEKQSAIPLDIYTGIGAESENQDLGFEVLTDMITDETLHEGLKEVSPEKTSIVFEAGLNEEEKEKYKETAETAPVYEQAHSIKKIDTPEIQAVRKVFLEYCQDEEHATADPLMRYFLENGTVTQESIKKGLDIWRQKLEQAGMSTALEQIRQLKEQEVTGQ